MFSDAIKLDLASERKKDALNNILEPDRSSSPSIRKPSKLGSRVGGALG